MKRKKIRIVLDYISIFAGTMVAAIAIDAFLTPSQLAPGGATGLSILINYLTKLPIGYLIFCINIPIFILGLKVFGKSYGLKTLAGITFLSLNVELVKRLVPSIDKIVDYANPENILLGTLYGGVLMGVGLGIVIKNGGTTGGSDILAGVINKYFKIPIGQALIMIDSSVMLAAGYIFGAEKALFALINLYATGVVINKIVSGAKNAKMAFIVTSELEKVRSIIVNDLGKTGNYYKVEGIYTRKERDIITTVLRDREIHLLKELISEVDKEAFVVVTDVSDVIGRGYTFDQTVSRISKK